MEASLPLFYDGGVESMEGGLLLSSDLYQPYQQQQQQMMMDSLCSSLPQMPVAPPSYSTANCPISLDLRLQSNLVEAWERILELEACLRRAEEEKETWQRIAKEHEGTIASLNNTLEQFCVPSTGSSPDASYADTCSSHPLAVEEPNEGKGMALACGSRTSHVLPLSCRHLCGCQLCEASLNGHEEEYGLRRERERLD